MQILTNKEQKTYFDKQIVHAAPVCWSKYTTFLYYPITYVQFFQV